MKSISNLPPGVTDRMIEDQMTDRTIAEEISDLIGDGTVFHTPDGVPLSELCEQRDAQKSYGRPDYEWDDELEERDHYRPIVREISAADVHSGDITRFVFPDGSVIVAAQGGWDLEGAEPFSWREICATD